MRTDTPSAPPEDQDFDLRVRAELALAFEPCDPPATLLREPRPWWVRRGMWRALGALALGAVGLGTLFELRPPALVRDAIEHEYYERTLRGSFMDPQLLLARLGLGQTKVLPGFPQLMRPCDIEGHLAYHLTTFFEKGGLVTVFAFDRPVTLEEGEGWWSGVHWRVIRSRDGRPLVLIAQKQRALGVAQAQLQGRAAAAPG
jgi:hypothetical protein